MSDRVGPAPKTIVLQSFRRHDVPGWLTTCLDSVRGWAGLRGYEYRFLDDTFFAVLPDWFSRSPPLPLTVRADYARALWAERSLAEGCARFIWVDADVLVFAPAHLQVEMLGSYGFCHEVLPVRDGKDGIQVHHRINNAISVYCQGNPFLDFYLHAMQQIVRGGQDIAHDALGTVLLSTLGQAMPLPVLFNVGLFSPQILQALVQPEPAILSALAAASRAPLAATNLCQSLRGRLLMGVDVTDALFDAAVALCLGSGGDCVNRYRPRTSTAPPDLPTGNG